MTSPFHSSLRWGSAISNLRTILYSPVDIADTLLIHTHLQLFLTLVKFLAIIIICTGAFVTYFVRITDAYCSLVLHGTVLALTQAIGHLLGAAKYALIGPIRLYHTFCGGRAYKITILTVW